MTAFDASAVLAGLDAAARAALIKAGRPVLTRAGADLLVEGAPNGDAHVVLSGSFSIRRGGVLVHTARMGEIIGDLSLLTGRPSSATVTARRDATTLCIPHIAVDAALATSAGGTRRLAEHLAGLVADAAPPAIPVAEPVRVIALISPCHVDDAGLVEEIGRGLAAGLAHLDVAVVAEIGPSTDPDGEVFAGDLASIEDAHDLVVLLATGDPAWVSACRRQADLVMIVVDPAACSPPRRAAPTTAEGAPVHLLLVHAGRPRDAMPWLRTTGASTVHHVSAAAPSAERDLARVARLVTGRGVTLVLGGGGPRGFAHIGVVRALVQRGIPIDAVGGTSIGSLMAAAVAMGWSPEEIEARAYDGLVRTKGLLSPTLPLVSLSSGRTVTRLLRSERLFGEVQAEDLGLPWFAVAASLDRAEAVVLDRGPVWRAVRASTALPGVLPPVPDGDDLLVDGGVIDDLPVGIMRHRHGGTVLAVDLQPDGDLPPPGYTGPHLSGWRLAGQMVRRRGWVPGVPNLVEIVLRSKEVGGRRAQRIALDADAPDVVFRPPVGDVPALEFKAATHLVAIGERHAHAVLDALEAAGRSPGAEHKGE